MVRILSRTDALSRGVTDSELQRYCRTSFWRRLRPGRFVSRVEFDALSPLERHRVVAEAVLSASTADDAVLSHTSAAVFHGIDILGADLSRVHITRNRSGGGRRTAHRVVHAAPYAESDVTVIDGFAVTSLARTIADVARLLSFEDAVCIADLAARTTGVTSEEVAAVLDSRPTHPENRKARRVANFMDGRSESVGESRCRLVLHELGYAPRLQVQLGDADGPFARIDFHLFEINTALEFDGRIKYSRLVPTGQTPSDVAWNEKLREDRIRAGGLQVVRITWADLENPVRVDGLLRAAAARAALSPPPTLTFT
ncbi:MAG: hypothetical protein WBQ44_15055 [Rhodococcus sp. (in: high G+C Gram-positive bacteria)]